MNPHDIIAKLGMFWPMGDPGQLRQARAAYRQCARDLGTVQAACQSTGNQVQAANQGPPIDGFAAWLAKWRTDPGYFPATIAACNQLADACDAYAQRIEESHRRIIELAIAAGVALGVGLALTVFTFGGSDAAAGVTIAGLVAASLAEGTALSTAAAESTPRPCHWPRTGRHASRSSLTTTCVSTRSSTLSMAQACAPLGRTSTRPTT